MLVNDVKIAIGSKIPVKLCNFTLTFLNTLFSSTCNFDKKGVDILSQSSKGTKLKQYLPKSRTDCKRWETCAPLICAYAAGIATPEVSYHNLTFSSQKCLYL